jgi:hypothetical protein
MYIASILLGVSVLGLIGLVLLKAIELRLGNRMFLHDVRERLGARLDEKVARLKAELPRKGARMSRLTLRIARAYISYGIAKALMSVESALEGALKGLRRAPRSVEQSGQASRFLREVAAYKRMLSKEERTSEDGQGAASGTEEK